MTILVQENYTLVTRHFIWVVYLLLKFGFLMLIASIIFFIAWSYQSGAGANQDVVSYVLFPMVLLLVNYATVQLILGIVRYYNRIFIIVRDKFIIINSSILFQEDIEIMDLAKVMKIDVECHGFLANILQYGTLILEQQKQDVRMIHFVPRPFKVLQILRERTNYISQQGQEDTRFFKNR